MPNYTTNLRLEKPLQSEQYNIDVFNANADKIDQFAGQIPPYALTADKLTTGAKINGVNFKGDSDITLPTVNTSGNQTVEGIKTFSEVIQGTIANAQNATNDVNGDKIDETYIKTADLADKWHALKGYSDEGELLTDAEGLADVKNYAHSTFDLSKFTVVGSPTITDDGIASGFSSGNYLKTATIDFTKPWEINTIFTVNGITGNSMLWVIQGGGWNNYIYHDTSQIEIRVKLSDNTEHILRISHTFTVNTLYICKMLWTGTSYCLRLYSNDGTLIDEKYYDSSLTLLQTSGFVQIGYGSGDSYMHKGSIDLKQFSITVDGVEVFSGNKTGIDTIKPDDYTVIGSPTITDDGMFTSTVTSNSYIKKEVLNLINASNYTIKFVVKDYDINSIPSGHYQFVFSDLNGTSANGLGLNISRGSSSIQIDLARAGIGNANIGYISFSETGNIYGEIQVNGNTAKCYITRGNVVLSKNIDITGYNTWSENFVIGNRTNDNRQFYGSIDLNAFKIYVDGQLVYQPCLKIPYTESKTGSKIADSFYRDRISDMYGQFGYAPYYTLSDTDFTLPQGELYGYLEKRARDIAHPVAVPFFRLTDEINEDEVRLEGAEVDKGLYLAIEQNLPQYCTEGSTSDKICLPDFRDRVPWGANTQGYIEAGLPNITGQINYGRGFQDTGNQQSGALSYSVLSSNQNGLGNTDAAGRMASRMDFDASLSNSIYNASSTVQPPAFKVRWLARYK